MIGDIEKQIEEQTKLIAAYQAESAARVAAFNEVSLAMTKVVAVEKVEADRAESDTAALDKIIDSSDATGLAAGTANSGKSLDPKASVFTPSTRPALPTSISSGPAAGSRAAAHSRKGKSASASASRANTPAAASKSNAAGAAKSRAEATTRKAAATGGRARSPLAGNQAKENASRAGGRRQAVNAPSQLGKSSISMEDGEISSNTSEGAGPAKQAALSAAGGKASAARRDGKSGGGSGGENAGGNKRHRADQEDGEAAKRRKVEEEKQEGVAGV